MYVPHPDLDMLLAGLTPRERQIVAYVAGGQPNKVIAIDLGISLRTVEAHRARIFTKLQARNAMQLACRLCAHGHLGASPVLGAQVPCAPDTPLVDAAALRPPYSPPAAMTGYTVKPVPVAVMVADSSTDRASKGFGRK